MDIRFDCLELVYNHQIQLRFKVLEDGVEENLRTVIAGEVGENVTVFHPSGPVTISTHPILEAVSKAFPKAEFKNPDGPCEHADFIRVMFNDPSQIRYNVTKYAYTNETEVLKATKMRSVGVDCLEYLSAHPEKVQKFCNIVFTPEVKAQYIASLPRKEIDEYESDGVTPKTKPVEVPVPARTEPRLIDGQIVDFEIEKATTRLDQVPVTQSFIEYKGNLYPEGWDGKL